MNKLAAIREKIIRSDDGRRSRLHDRKGNLVPFARIAANGMKAIGSYIVWRLFDKRPVLPWISYSAVAVIEKSLDVRTSSVLEFGSGMSTLWFCRHAKRVVSVEHDKEWFEVVDRELKSGRAGPANAEYHLAQTCEEYSTRGLNATGEFDMILVDGPWRNECLKNSMHLAKPGGTIYLDNSDADSSSGEPGEIDKAVETLVEFARKRGARVEVFTDFCPTLLFAIQGVLVQLPHR